MEMVGKTKLLRQSYLRVTSSIKHLTLTGLELDAVLTGYRPAANCLSQGTALLINIC
jgi:hypothetical protein